MWPTNTWKGWVRFLGSAEWRLLAQDIDFNKVMEACNRAMKENPHFAAYEIIYGEDKPRNPFK